MQKLHKGCHLALHMSCWALLSKSSRESLCSVPGSSVFSLACKVMQAQGGCWIAGRVQSSAGEFHIAVQHRHQWRSLLCCLHPLLHGQFLHQALLQATDVGGGGHAGARLAIGAGFYANCSHGLCPAMYCHTELLTIPAGSCYLR